MTSLSILCEVDADDAKCDHFSWYLSKKYIILRPATNNSINIISCYKVLAGTWKFEIFEFPHNIFTTTNQLANQLKNLIKPINAITPHLNGFKYSQSTLHPFDLINLEQKMRSIPSRKSIFLRKGYSQTSMSENWVSEKTLQERAWSYHFNSLKPLQVRPWNLYKGKLFLLLAD